MGACIPGDMGGCNDASCRGADCLTAQALLGHSLSGYGSSLYDTWRVRKLGVVVDPKPRGEIELSQ